MNEVIFESLRPRQRSPCLWCQRVLGDKNHCVIECKWIEKYQAGIARIIELGDHNFEIVQEFFEPMPKIEIITDWFEYFWDRLNEKW